MTAGKTLIAVLIAVAALAESVLVWLGSTAWRGYQEGGFTAEEAAPYVVMGLSAAAGAILALLAMAAVLRGPRGHRLAQVVVGLSWLRWGAVIIALAVVVIALGTAEVVPLFGIVLAAGDAIGGVVVSGAAMRRTRSLEA